MSIADRTWDTLPPEILSRIMAATAHADVRLIRGAGAAHREVAEEEWEVNSLANDRFVHMALGVRSDGSVAEATETFLINEVVHVSFDADGATVELGGGSGHGSLRIPEEFGREISRRRESGA